MMTKQMAIFIGLLFISGMTQMSIAEMNQHNMDHSKHDGRTSLELSPEMKQHQLSNMRAHLEAVQTITGLIAEGAFDEASEVAHSKLGLTEEMDRMCNMFEDKGFTELGLAFHKSGDELGEVLLTKDTNNSLRALQATVGYCVQCHAVYRQ